MGDVLVETPPNPVLPLLYKRQPATSNAEASDFPSSADIDEYSLYKRLQRELEYINLQEEYIKDEQR